MNTLDPIIRHGFADYKHAFKQFSDKPTPYMVTDLDKIADNCKQFKHHFPSVELHYAIKAFYTKEIIDSIDDRVDGFDVASNNELKDILSYGVAAKRIMYSNPVKSKKSIEEAFSLGVDKFAFQSMSELGKLQMNAPGSSVYLRVKIDDSHSEVPLSGKFGCEPKDVVRLLTHAKNINLNPVGITFHVGSQLLDSTAWESAVKKAGELLVKVKKAGIDVDTINLGGGLPAQYFTDDPTIDKLSPSINNALLKNDWTKYIAEPGRFIVADSSFIVSSVIGVEKRGQKNWAFLDVGLFQAFLGALRYKKFPYGPIVSDDYLREEPAKRADLVPFIITGPSCDSEDTIHYEALLPEDLSIDDRLIFPNTGAYTLVYGSSFNGFEVPPVYFLKDQKVFSRE